jgi:hypothetical protein
MFFLPNRMLLVVAAVAVVLSTGCGEPVKVPTSYAKWEPEGGTIFHIDYPEGWKAEGGGKKPKQWAEFKKSGCLINCDTNMTTSVVADIGKSLNTLGGGDEGLSQEEIEERAPAAAAHDVVKKSGVVAQEYSSYKEEKKAIAFNSGLGDARKTVFTASAAMGRRVKGYRATILARDYGIVVVCHCPEKDFEKMRPAFDKVLESVRSGGG